MRDVYAHKAIAQIPRLLSLLDRNPYSTTYGCFFREYWHDKMVDFPSGHFQCSVYPLALVYKHQMPGNIYYKKTALKKWILAALDYSIKIQHGDGSFDELYPNERGRAVTGILLYCFVNTIRIFKDELTEEEYRRYRRLCERCAAYIMSAPRQSTGLLANHFTMILCALMLYYKEFGDDQAFVSFQRYRKEFLELCYAEGWSLEYDGPDPGYLTATISFIAKFWPYYQDDELRDYVQRALEFCSYFVYPNGSYGGSMGSRQTLHFYSHGFEYFGRDFPLAQACGEKMRVALQGGKLVPPEIQSDRYCYYRIEEYLLSYLDYCPRNSPLPLVPYEGKDFKKYFEQAKIYVEKRKDNYIVINLLRGGIVKAFRSKEMLLGDSGIILLLENRKIFSSQWIDPEYKFDIDLTQGNLSVNGSLNLIPTQLFNPWKMSLFKIFMVVFGNSQFAAEKIKAQIRRAMIVGKRKSGKRSAFQRSFQLSDSELVIHSRIRIHSGEDIKAAMIGNEMHLRYVPQSRYFQRQELDTIGYELTTEDLRTLKAGEWWLHTNRVPFSIN